MSNNPKHRQDKRPTLADVAKLAGVSLGSASRALSVPDELRPETLAKVKQAVNKLGYIPHGAARALASRRTNMIAALYPTLNNPIFARSTHSMQKTLWKHGYQLLLTSHEYQIDDELAVIRSVVERGVDGIIMTGTDHSDELFSLLHRYEVPYVMTWSVDDSDYPYCIGISNFDSAYQITELVLSYGHSKIGVCGGPIERNERARGRRNGVIAAAKNKGIEIPKKWIIEQPFSYEGGRQAMREFHNMDDAPTAIFFGTDILAMGALDECRKLNIKVPEQISIIGFDGSEESGMTSPSLTTIALPAHEIGHRSAELMIQLINQKDLTPEPPMPTIILKRESLGRAPR